MRTRIVTIVLLMLVVFSSCDKEARERRKKLKPIDTESVESLSNTANAIDWNNHVPPAANLDEANEPCYQNLMAKIRALPKIKVDKNRIEDLRRMYEFSRLIQEPVDAGKFGEIEGHDLPDIIPFPIRDRILRKVDEGYSKDEFVREVKGNGSLSDDDASKLGEIFDTFNDEIKNKSVILAVSSTQDGNCALTQTLFIRLTEVQHANKALAYRLKRQVTFVCDCTENSDPTQPNYGHVDFESTITASYEEKGLYNLVFGNATRPEIAALNIVCCRNGEGHEEEQEEEDQQNQEGGH